MKRAQLDAFDDLLAFLTSAEASWIQEIQHRTAADKRQRMLTNKR